MVLNCGSTFHPIIISNKPRSPICSSLNMLRTITAQYRYFKYIQNNYTRGIFGGETQCNISVYSTVDTVYQAGLFWVDWLPFLAKLKRMPFVASSLIIGKSSEPPTTQMAPPEARLSITVNPFSHRKVIKLKVPFLFP